MADVNEVLTGTAEGLSEVTKEAKKSTEAVKQQNTEVSKSAMAWGAAGSAASAALGSLSAGLGKTNPLLGSLFSSVQKMIPLFTGMGQAAQAAGVSMKSAMASTGIGLLLVALGEAVGFLVSMKTKADEAKASLDKIGDSLAATLNLEAWKRQNDLVEEFGQEASDRINEYIEANAKWAVKGEEQSKKAWSNMLIALKGFSDEQRSLIQQVFNDRVNAIKQEKEAEANAEKERTEQAKAAAAKAAAEAKRKAEEYAKFLKELSEGVDEEADWSTAVLSKAGELFASLIGYSTDLDSMWSSFKSNSDMQLEWLQLGMTAEQQEIAAINERAEAFKDAGISEIEATAWAEEEKEKIRKKYQDAAAKEEKDRLQERMNNITASADAFANMFDGLATLLESDEKNNKKNAKKIKALKIATATIDMLSGSLKAWNSGMEAGGPLGPVVGAANVAATVALGVANINKIKNTDVEGGSSGATASVTTSVAPQQTYIANPTSNQDVVDAVNNNTSVTSSVQTVLVVDDYKKVADQANRVQVQSSF